MDSVLKPRARWRWGRKTNDGEFWSLWIPNVITKGYAELVGGLLSQANTGHFESPPGTAVGFASPVYMIVGKGDPTWDMSIPEYGPLSTIEVELSRKVCVVEGYLPDGSTEITDPLPGNTSPATIRRPVFSATWADTELYSGTTPGPNDPVAIREIALVGGPGATTLGAPLQYMINLLRIAPVFKGSVDPYTLVFQCELWIDFE